MEITFILKGQLGQEARRIEQITSPGRTMVGFPGVTVLSYTGNTGNEAGTLNGRHRDHLESLVHLLACFWR